MGLVILPVSHMVPMNNLGESDAVRTFLTLTGFGIKRLISYPHPFSLCPSLNVPSSFLKTGCAALE